MSTSVAALAAPRLYYVDPRRLGALDRWNDTLDHVRALGFDGIALAPSTRIAEDGTALATVDPFALDAELVRKGSDGRKALAALVKQAQSRQLVVVIEVALAHLAASAPLVDEHPDWLFRAEDGTPLEEAGAFRLALHADNDAQRAYATSVLTHYMDTGIAGLRLARAHRVPAPFWRAVLGQVRERFSNVWLIADMLGAPADLWPAYEDVGFTGVLDSSRWWNFHDRWFVEQQPHLARIGTPFAFPALPEGAITADGDPVARRHALKARYLAAVSLGAGLFVPMGYETGAPGAVVAGEPVDPTPSADLDLSTFIKAANGLKRTHPTLANGGPLRQVNAPNARATVLARVSHASWTQATEALFVCANPAGGQADGVDPLGLLRAAGGRFNELIDVTPGARGRRLDPSMKLTLDPGEVRLLASCATPAKPIALKPLSAAAERRLRQSAQARVAIEKVSPELDGGRFPIKRVVGDTLEVEADVFLDGHDKLAASLLVRTAEERRWTRVPMVFVENDRWRGNVPLTRNTRYVYTIEAWHDAFGSWRVELTKKHAAGVPITLELEEGRRLVRRTAEGASGAQREALEALLDALEGRLDDEGFQLARLLSAEVETLMAEADLKLNLTRHERELEVVVDRAIAASAAWYELFPRSQSDDPARHGTFDDVIAKLPYVRDMGFDVLYFPPIHPIGKTNRKGRNNSLTAQEGDPGSPYAIGAAEGGHTALHPELGTFDDFARLVEAAHEHGLELAIDFAIQCSPDHPWLKEHPNWFAWRPDGSLRYAENPPKKYEDITNVDFYADGAMPSLWLALRDVVQFWVDHGVKIFRVDNPHTKPLPFWEWLIADIQSRHPEAVFLSEAFTRPKVMRRLAKIGFTQSYSYFTWRNGKQELQEYLTELTKEESSEHMRPNFFVNTPDINPIPLQTSGRAGFQARAVLASTLSTLWGVYSGFELCEGTPLPGKEEYLDSEKYEIKAWDWHRPANIRDDIRLLNTVRRENPALWTFTNLEFHNAWNDHVMVYSKMTPALDNAVLIAVSLDPHNAQSCTFEVPLWHFGLADHASIAVEDLVTGARFTWTGKMQHVLLDPNHRPYQLWRLIPPGLASASLFADHL